MQTLVLPDIAETMNEVTFSSRRSTIGWVCVLIANEKKFELSSNNYNFGKLVSGIVS